MKVIGITGNIGCGKSLVAKYIFEKHGIEILDSDIIAKEVLEKNKSGLKKFGKNILEGDKINLDNLFQNIFTDDKKIQQYNRWIHPLVGEETSQRLARCQSDLVILSSPLIFEARVKVDYLILVLCNEWIRTTRILKRCLEKAENFEQAKKSYQRHLRLNELQFSDEISKYYSDYVIDNNGSIEETKEQADWVIFKNLKNRRTK
jgi:dephospho-CoA kinase